MAPPKIAPEMRRREVVSFWVNTQELKQVIELVEKRNAGRSETMRSLVAAAHKREVVQQH